MSTQELITISKAYYDRLKLAQFELQCLHAGGVDNWEGYSESLRDGGFFEDDDDEWGNYAE